MEKPPRSVAIFAFVCSAIGITSVMECCLQLLLFDRFDINPGFLFLFLSSALNRRSEIARNIATFVVGWGLFSTILGCLLFFGTAIFGPAAFSSESGNPTAAVVALPFLVVAWREITSEHMKAWFALGKIPKAERNPFQFRMKTILLWFTVAAFLLAFRREEILYYPYQVATKSSSSPNGSITVNHVVRRSRLSKAVVDVAFVVLEVRSIDGISTSRLHYSSSPREHHFYLETPDDVRHELTRDRQLYEIRDGSYRTIPGRLTKAQLDILLQDITKYHRLEDLLAIPEPTEAE